MPAKGRMPSAIEMRVVASSSSHSRSAVIVSGIEERSRTSDVVNRTANSTPASAAARGEFSGRRAAGSAWTTVTPLSGDLCVLGLRQYSPSEGELADCGQDSPIAGSRGRPTKGVPMTDEGMTTAMTAPAPSDFEGRRAYGRAARIHTPRTSHGDWSPPEDRPDPVSLLEQQAVSRVPDLVPIRHGRMMVSPFTFYRGAALLMASDLSRTPSSGLTLSLIHI